MRRILIAANVAPGETGGVAHVVRAQAAAMRSLSPGCAVELIPGGTSYAAYQLRCLRWWLRHPVRPAAVIGHGADGVLLLALGRVLGTPRLITVWHGVSVTLDRLMRKLGYGGQIPTRQYWTTWLSVRLARQTFVLSRADRLWLRLAWRIGAEILPQGRLRASRPVDGQQPARASGILFLGYPSLRKGFDRFIASAGRVDLPFLHIGAAAWSGPQAGVRSLGPLDHGRVCAFLSTEAVVVAAPSRYEGSPLAVVEALSLGRPVVATGWGGQRELLRGTGMYVRAPADLYARLSQIAADYATYCAQAESVAARLPAWSVVAQRLLGLPAGGGAR